ncbi:unnamed protein product [Calypogeia fissa]
MAEKTGMTAMIRKWVGLTAGIMIQSLAGGGMCYANYSVLLKSVMGINQVQLNNMGVAKDFGENVGLLAGFVCNLLPPWGLLLIGAAEGFIGYGVIFLVLTERIAPLAYWQMTILLCLAANGTSFYNTAVLVTSMRNFPQSRGTVVGIIKGFIGLSGAIYTQIYIVVLVEDPASFVLFLALSPVAVVLVTMYFIQPVKSPTGDQDPEEEASFFFVQAICIILALFLLVVSFAESAFTLSALIGRIIITIMCILIFSPLAVPAKFLVDKYFRGGRKGFRTPNPNNNKEPLLQTEGTDDDIIDEENGRSEEEEDSKEPQRPRPSVRQITSRVVRRHHQPGARARLEKSNSLCLYPSPDLEDDDDDNQQTMLAVGEGAVQRKKGPRRGEDFTLTEALVKADFWLLFFTFFCAAGTSATAVNNLGQIGQALGYGDVTVFVSLYSICNFLGRLCGGSASEYYVSTFTKPRTAVMIIAQMMMIIGHLLFATAVSGSLLIGSILLGFACGVHYTIMVPTASELFGLRDFGMIYNFITVGSPLASLLFSGVIAGYFYDIEEAKDPSPDGTCQGAHCYRAIFLIMAGVCFVGLLANIVLTLRITPVYQSLYGDKLRNANGSSYESLSLDDNNGDDKDTVRRSSGGAASRASNNGIESIH